jgi:hypothetical protein
VKVSAENIPDDIRRFILTSIESVPHLEALLQCYKKPDEKWDAEKLGGVIYVDIAKAERLLKKLCSAGFIGATVEEKECYFFNSRSEELKVLVGKVDEVYSKHLIEITNLIHGKSTEIRKFSDAFKIK